MKNILCLFGFIILCSGVYGQGYDPTRPLFPINGDGFIWKKGAFKTMLRVPSIKPTYSIGDKGSIIFDTTDSKFYGWDGSGYKLLGGDEVFGLGCIKVFDSLGVKWIRDTCSYSGSQWLLTGNAGTTPGTNFIGTTDDKDLVFKRNNLESGRIGAVTYLGINAGNLDLGVNNTFIGLAAGRNNNGNNNSGFGQGSMDGASGSYNTGVGFNSMLGNTGSFSTSAGFGAGVNNTGNYLTAIGYLAAHQNTSKYVTAIGDSAAYANPYRSIIALGRKASANANYQFAIYDSITHFRIPGYLPASFDTTANKPMVFNPTTKVAQYLDHWPGAAAATTPGLNAVLGVDSVAYHNIFLKGSKSFSTMSDGLGFGEATLYHTEGTGGQLYLTRSSGYGANLMPVSGATTVSTHFLPDTTGTYLLYVNGVAPNSKGKLRLSSFPDSIVTPLIKSTGGGALTVKVGSNTPMIFNADGTISVSGAISSSSTFTGTVISSSLVLRTSGFLDFGGGTSRLSAGSADGNMKITNSGGTDFGMMQYGGTSSSYPAIKRSGTKIQIRLADDSNFGTVEASNIRSGTGSPESAITAPVGTIYARTDGDTTDAAYLKTSGTGNTGWERMGVKKFKEYVAILSQSGTDAPVATVLQNELGPVTFSRTGVGQYTLTCTGAFSSGKVFISQFKSVLTDGGDTGYAFYADVIDSNVIAISSYGMESTGGPYYETTAEDNHIFKVPITIRVYY